ncbi:hypothetical protein GPECTOR_22g917 [Gonium pectorale]|uniref:DUF1802 family protein n=1 Tax=Gonium pectorale TaxID=33097 RepID=A0A150GHR0_GONPE|nr:hypothetical protein GPECTOR_22g917 [Gonium pectorale]|eukprot:KXZ49323.1 hypothetical protein GPECTOR_22g917 [Gonium pectorale]
MHQRSARRRDVAHRLSAASLDAPAAPLPAAGVRVTKALKEWAPTVEAIGQGEQTILFRKGGIKEPTFKPEATTFLLFPTAFHTDQQLLKPGVAERYAQALRLDPKAEPVLQLPYVAQVTGAWTTFDPSVLPALHDFHVWTEQFIETRLKWRAKQPITVLELRAWRLRQPLDLATAESMFGCFSWVDLADHNLSDLMAGAQPVIGDADYAERQRRLRAALAQVPTEPLHLD